MRALCFPAAAGGTRTCIHTPGEPMLAEEVSAELAAATLEGAALAYFDGRLTEAALVLAAEAQRRGVPLLVEAERLRPGECRGDEYAYAVLSLICVYNAADAEPPGNVLLCFSPLLLTGHPALPAPPCMATPQAWSSCCRWPTMSSPRRTSRRAGRGSSAWGTRC